MPKIDVLLERLGSIRCWLADIIQPEDFLNQDASLKIDRLTLELAACHESCQELVRGD